MRISQKTFYLNLTHASPENAGQKKIKFTGVCESMRKRLHARKPSLGDLYPFKLTK